MKKLSDIFGALGAPRATQEGFLKNRGWARLLDRADVWINTRAPGEHLHDVWLFRFALEAAIRTEHQRRKAARELADATHHNEAWLAHADLEAA